jgi:hypothetical protein
VRRRHPCYTVEGAGKTGMDACLWLLANGVEPERIRWIRARDPSVMDRAYLQPFAENFELTMQGSMAVSARLPNRRRRRTCSNCWSRTAF